MKLSENFNAKEWVKENLFNKRTDNSLALNKGIKRLPPDQERLVCEYSAEAGCRYAINVLGKRLPKKYEEKVLQDKEWFIVYTLYVLKKRLPREYEDKLDDPKFAFMYSKFALQGKLPDHLHNFMLMKSFECPDNSFVKGYFDFIKEEKPISKSKNGLL